jgi:predicted MPP superfamily phosphohydrolase
LPKPVIKRPSVKTRIAHWIGRTWAHYNYGRHVEPTWLELNQHTLPIQNLPASFSGLRIAHLSDLHDGQHLPQDYICQSIDLTLKEQPDLIAITGDFIHKGYKHVEHIAKKLKRLHAPLGVFAVLGNHDFSVRNALGFRRHRGLHLAVANALTHQGIRVLRNETVPLIREDSKIFLAGLDDLWSRECNPDAALGGLCEKTPRIVLAHNPQTIHELGNHRCDVMLSGHTHGGQINLPLLGRLFLSKSARRLAAGLYHQDNTHIYVSKGVGCGFRFRYGVRPEVAILTLKPYPQSNPIPKM